MYKFIFEEDLDNQDPKYPRRIEMLFDDNTTWDDLLHGFIYFLRANGFMFPNDVEATIIDNTTGEDLGLKARFFKDEYLTEEDDEDTSS